MNASHISCSLFTLVVATACAGVQAAPRFVDLGALPGQRGTTAALGDVDGDGREDLVAAGRFPTQAGNVAVWDFASGTAHWLSPAYSGGVDDPFRIATQTVGLARRASQAHPRVVLSGAYSAFHIGAIGHVVVLEPPAMTPVLQIGGEAFGAFGSVDAATLYDWNEDGSDELLALEGTSFWSPAWPRLRVLSLDDGAALWTSDGFGGPVAQVRDVFVLPGGSPATDTFVASITTGLYAFGRAANSAVWEVPIANNGAAYVAQGVAGPEIVLLAPDGGLIFLDATTRAVLRSFTIEASFHSIQALGGDVGSLLAAADDVLLLIDGRTGGLLASSASLGTFDPWTTRIGAAYQGGGVWHLAPATNLAAYRYRLELTEAIYADGFETPP